MAAPTNETDGIVIDCRDHGESDIIVTLYTRDTGKTGVIAKGAKRSIRRFVNKLEIFSFLHLQLRKSGNKSLLLLEEADLHAGFITLRSDIKKYSVASVIRELLILSTREESDEGIYQLTLWSFYQLDTGSDPLHTLMCFLVKFFDYIGYRPELECCIICGVTEDKYGFDFNVFTGGLICKSCGGSSPQALTKISEQTISLIKQILDCPIDKLSAFRAPENITYEVLNILHKHGRHILQRDIVSWKMLRSTFLGSPFQNPYSDQNPVLN